MASRRRSDNPMTIMVLGIMAVAFFGVIIVYFNQKTPILQLRPLVEKEFQLEGVVSRFHRGKGLDPPYIRLELPSDAELSTERLQELAAFALRNYVILAKDTLVFTCRVRLSGDEQPYRVVVTRQQVEGYDLAREDLATQRQWLHTLGFETVVLRVTGMSRSGAAIQVEAKAKGTRKRLERIARKVSRRFANAGYTGLVTVSIQTPHGVIRSIAGRDAPKQPKRRTPKRSRQPGPTPPPEKSGSPD